MKHYIILIFILFITFLSFYFSIESFEENSFPNSIDIVYYINLDHREDRKSQFLSGMDNVNIKNIERIPAIYDKEHGHIGCTKSHIKTLKTFLESPHNICIIFEDDFEWSSYPNNTLKQFFDAEIPFDVCMLSGSYSTYFPTKYPFLYKINDAQTTSGYMVTRKFAPILLKNYEEGLRLLERPEYDHSKYAIDQYWKKLQPPSRWYIFEPKLGKQISSVSDIQRGFVEMDV